jgi:FkbM family methyltransferase
MNTYVVPVSVGESENSVAFEMIVIDDIMGEKIKATKVWESMLSAYVLTYISAIQKPFIFLDIGANVGYYSMLALESNPNALVVAFEPHPEVFSVLQRNLSKYGNRVVCCELGLGVVGREAVLSYAENNFGSGTLFPETLPEDQNIRSFNIQIASIDDLGIDWNIVSFVKVDTQGNESDIYRKIFPKLSLGACILAEDDLSLRQTIFQSDFGAVYCLGNNYLVEKFTYR